MPHVTDTLRKLPYAAIAALFLCNAAFAQSRPFVSFDVPGAVGHTAPKGINNAGQVVGNALGTAYHGFVRKPDGQITQIDVPNARNTFAVAINSSGMIAGYAEIALAGDHSFLRTASGRFIPFVYPGATQTVAQANDSGVITGYYADSNSVFHGFVRDAFGTLTSFDAPDAGTGNGQGSIPTAINSSGVITGYYRDGTVGNHGFVRDAAGNITDFDVSGSSSTSPGSVNSNGDITGNYTDSGGMINSFVRHSNGSFDIVTAAGAASTFASSISDGGYICGYTFSATGHRSGFLRSPSQALILYSGPQPNSGGECDAMSNNLRATGIYIDGSGVWHGWVK